MKLDAITNTASSVRHGLSGDAIRAYDELKLKIAGIAQAAMQRCKGRKDEETARLYQALLARLAEDRFNLAVVGQFSRGKSSLMNAILGVDRLPTGLLPHTSVVTTVAYGEEERIVIRTDGWSLPHEVPLSELAEYVTENGNPGNRRRVISAEIQLPIELLRRGLCFIDTPGVGSAIAANTATTRHFLPEADSAVFVSSFDSPLGNAEIQFLKEVRSTVGKVFFVVNKLDLVSDQERDEVVRYVRERLAAELGEDQFELFAVSAKNALRAKLQHDSQELDRSGLPELESALVRFLTNEKTGQLCRRVLDRLIELIKCQRIEASLASSTRDDSRTAMLDIKSTVEGIHARRHQLVGEIRATASKNVPLAVRPRLDAIFAELKASTLRKFTQQLSDSRVLFEASPTASLLGQVSRFLAVELTNRLGTCTALIETEVEKAGQPRLDELKRLPAQTWASLVRIQRAADGRIDLAGDDLEPLYASVAVGRAPEIEYHGHLPWRVYFVPLRWMTEAVSNWFEATVCELLASYRTKADFLVAIAAQDFVSQVDREIEKRIDACAARLTNLACTEDAPDREISALDSLLTRAIDLRRTFAKSPAEGAKDDAPSVTGDTSGCPVCNKVSERIFDFLSRHQYRLSTDEAAQIAHARAGGFCSLHTWMYATLTSPQGICRAYPELLTKRGAELKQAATSPVSTGALQQLVSAFLPSASKCAVCDLVRRTEIEAVIELLGQQLAAGGDEPYNPALCLPHLSIALKIAPAPDTARALTLASATSLERAADLMRRFALKFDALRQNLMSREERRAHSTGLSKLVGDRRVTINSVTEDRF
jgi:predicted GTPase